MFLVERDELGFVLVIYIEKEKSELRKLFFN